MKKTISSLGLFLLLCGGGAIGLLASEVSTPTAIETPSSNIPLSITQVPGPIVLGDLEKMHDSENHSIPSPPGKNVDGKPLQLENSAQLPLGEALNSLADPSFLPQIESFNKSENKSKIYYWHSLKGMDYVHFRSGTGVQWYGWSSGGDFYWTLYLGKHFWWHDVYAERWLYFDRGYWRWQGLKKNQFQVYLENGHYYDCSANGTLGEDLFTTGTEEDVTEPVVKETFVPLNKQDDKTTSGQGGLDSFNHQYH